MSTVMKHMPPVVVEEGDVTVLRRMAAYTWGRYAVTWPEGFEPPELAPDRELGFVAKLPTPEGGRFSRRFVRADAEVDAANGYSNVESILDEAEERTGGDVFFERDITTAGLGRLVPRVHFDIGDIIPVRIWGRVIHLPVTSIDEVSEVGDRAGWRVHVGGQLISDRDALEAGTSELERVIAQERRERVDGDAAVMGVAEGAQASADGLAEDLTGDTDTKPSDAVEQRTGTLGLLADEVEAAQWAAIEANDSAIRENDARLDEQEALLMQLQAQQRELASRSHVVMAVAYLDDPYEDDYIRLTVERAGEGLRHRIDAKGDWMGYAYLVGREVSWGGITGALGYRAWSVDVPNGYNMERVAGIYSVLPGRQRLNNNNTGAFTPSGWHTIDTYTATTTDPARDMMINLRVGWDAATFGDEYGLRVTVNGTPRYTLGPVTGLGPLTPIGGFLFDTGHKVQTLNTTLESVPKGAVVRMQVYSSANSASRRRVRSTRLTMSWVEEAVAE